MDGEGLVDPDDVATVLRELQVCRDPSVDKAKRWIRDLEEQLETFKAQREKDDEEEEEEEGELVAAVAQEDLRYFDCLPHLLWWTLCSAISFFSGETPQNTAANVFVPGQRNFDDFLCIMPQSGYQDADRETGLSRALCNLLTAYDSHESIRKASFPEAEEEVSEETREKTVELFASLITSARRDPVDAETAARQLELGCNLYACMVATVESSRDALSLMRWRECYLAKCKETAEWLATPVQGENAEFKLVWDRANAEPDYALLVPFTKREVLFAGRRKRVKAQIEAQLVAAKKLFDVEHDHSQIESDFECPRCGSFKTRSYHMQTSGADESMAQFWRCWNCKKSGKKQ